MRNQGLREAETAKLQGDIQVNTHPNELKNPDRLIGDLRRARKRHPNLPITLEIHEQAVTGNGDLLRLISNELHKLKIKLAFDDFGVGQSRLTELVEVKPDLVKFDKALIKNIDQGDEGRLNLLRHLRDLTSDLHILTLAECINTEGEFNICQGMGFDLYQGFFISSPKRINQL